MDTSWCKETGNRCFPFDACRHYSGNLMPFLFSYCRTCRCGNSRCLRIKFGKLLPAKCKGQILCRGKTAREGEVTIGNFLHEFHSLLVRACAIILPLCYSTNLVPRARARFWPAEATHLASVVLTKRNATSGTRFSFRWRSHLPMRISIKPLVDGINKVVLYCISRISWILYAPADFGR